MKKQTIEQPFETELGIINVGDPVVILTTSAHHARMMRGEYLGYIETPGWKCTLKRVRARVEYLKYTWRMNDTNEVYSRAKHGPHDRATSTLVPEKAYRYTTLQRNRMIPVAQWGPLNTQ